MHISEPPPPPQSNVSVHLLQLSDGVFSIALFKLPKMVSSPRTFSMAPELKAGVVYVTIFSQHITGLKVHMW